MKSISLFFMFLVFVEGVFGESVSVKEGESITLHSDLPEIKKDDVIDWRFGAEKILIARVNKNNIPITNDDALNGRFRDRLKLDGQTGDLTIRNIRASDFGNYEVTNSINTYRKSVSVSGVSGSGLSGGAITGIFIAVVAVVVAAGLGFYYGYWKKRQML